MKALQIVNSNFIPAEMNISGRLMHDFSQNQGKVMLTLTEAIIRAHVVMGLNMDAQKVNLTATEALKKIIDVYPHAWIEDIVKSLQMASYGEIKLSDQLTTISPANIYGWYKEFRTNFGHLTKSPPPKEITVFEPTEEQKKAIMRKAFYHFINEPKENDTALDIYYNKLIVIGAMEVSDEIKLSEYLIEASKMNEAPPYEFLTERKIRKQLYEYQDYYKSLENKAEFKFNLFVDNFVHKRVIFCSKRNIVTRFLKTADKVVLMDLFDKYQEKNKV
jgi:hypothetical protein